MSARQIPRIAHEQGGVFTAAQARHEGWTARQIRRRLTAGRWQYVAGRALAVPRDGGWTAYQLSVAGQVSFPAAVSSHITAAQLHRLPVDGDGRSHLTTLGIHRTPYNTVVHRVLLRASEVVCLDGLVMATDPARTALDCMAMMGVDEQLRLWSWVSTRQILSVAALGQATADRRGHPGNARLRQLLALVRNGAVSAAEHRFHKILRGASLFGWSTGVTIYDGAGTIIAIVDILFARQRLVIEIDGYAAHSSKHAFIRDRRRQNRLVAAGYTVLRFSWEDLTQQPHDVVRQIRHALASAASSGPKRPSAASSAPERPSTASAAPERPSGQV